MSLAQATPAIEQFLLNERKRQAVDAAIKAARGSAKIEYQGKFAEPAAAAASAAPSPAPAPAAAASQSLDDATVKKGMGLK